MIYKIVSNGRFYKIQRKGTGLILKWVRKWYHFNYKWKYDKATILNWEDVSNRDLGGSSEEIEIYWDQETAEKNIRRRIEEDQYQETKDNWKIIKVIDDKVKLKRPLPPTEE